MCNEIARRIALGEIRDDWSELKVPLVFPEGLPNLAPLDSIRITDSTLILRASTGRAGAADEEAEGVVRRWSWPSPTGKPVYNFRSEGRAFANAAEAGRCLVPADAFFEFTEPATPAAKRARKHKWRFTKTGEDWFAIAGWWRRDAAVGEAFTLLTGEPGPDVAPYHRRQIMVLERRDWAGWLAGTAPAAAVLHPLPAGSFAVEQVC